MKILNFLESNLDMKLNIGYIYLDDKERKCLPKVDMNI